jgi:hypothetical protein
MSEPQSASPEVRIGILGSGWMGSVHAECYPRIKGVKVVGVFSRNLERAKTAAKICDAKAVGDASALLDDPDVDAVDVCLPSVNHEEFVAKALERGKHVFCETPFALTFTEAEAMLKAAKEAGRAYTHHRGAQSLRARAPAFCRLYPRRSRPGTTRRTTRLRSAEAIASNPAVSKRTPDRHD